MRTVFFRFFRFIFFCGVCKSLYRYLHLCVDRCKLHVLPLAFLNANDQRVAWCVQEIQSHFLASNKILPLRETTVNSKKKNKNNYLTICSTAKVFNIVLCAASSQSQGFSESNFNVLHFINEFFKFDSKSI